MKTWSHGEAEMVRQLLGGYGVQCQVAPRTVFPIGEVRVLVPERDLHAARVLLAEHRRQGFEVIRGDLDRVDGDDEVGPG